ncbi:MAG: nuclear transport factor 2 family protein [Terriglobales bacterium]
MSLAFDEQQILALFEAGDKALMNADLEALFQIFADDYVQYDDSGNPQSREAILEKLLTGAIRYPSIVSTRRKIRLFGDTAVVHGSESDEVEAEGKRFAARYIYLDVLLRRNGEWKIVASQLARLAEP